MSLPPGTRIGPYEIGSLLGQGGMGEVYRARDAKLARDVAIKVLPERLGHDAERVARFEREARTLASLNHPNIAQVYGFEHEHGTMALAMELVDGEDLSRRLARGAVLPGDALSIARQIAEGLAYAHDRGIVHRDLKPANIKVTPAGVVKILDFGIAKVLAPAADDVTAMATQEGVVLGTPAYMSPEQARGEEVRSSSDIWSFGVVLYELLTGASPFGKRSTAETLASVLGDQPDYSVLPAGTPANVRRLLRRCLQKDAKDRWHHIGDVRIEIEEALAGPTSDDEHGDSVLAVTPPRRMWMAMAAIGLVLVAGLAGWWMARRPAPSAAGGAVHLTIPLLEQPSFIPNGARHVTISEDGSTIAYTSINRLWIRRMDSTDVVTIEVVGGSNPFFSPNGDWLGFFGQLGTGEPGLKKVPSRGGAPVAIAATADRPGGASWGADGTIVFATSQGLFQVSENGGESRLLVKPDPGRKEQVYAWPHFLADGKSLLFTIVPQDSAEGTTIASLDLATLAIATVVKGGSAPHATPNGRLVYASGQAMRVIAFDNETKQTRGDPALLPGLQVETTANGAAEFAVSRTGTLIAIPPTASRELRGLSWVDREGKEEPLTIAPGRLGYPRVSPDGTRVSMDLTTTSRDIWIWSLQRPSLTRLTDGPTEDLLSFWSPDSQRLYFASDRTGNFDLYSQAADGATPARRELASKGTQIAAGITPDGTRVFLTENFQGLSLLDLRRPDHAEPFLPGKFNRWLPAVSPDGNWVAYESNESGNQMEILLRPFPDVDRRLEKISLNGGRYPLWGRKGTNELFYVDLEGNMMAASVTLSPSLSLGRVTKLFSVVKPGRGISGRPYDISPIDGRFLITKVVVPGDQRIDLAVVLNWFDELQQRLAPSR